ncbi:hypothetical protein A3J17_02215 [Candidatus Curtissbacteria bacterium RIFCSPLOWO2_02_FULL_40_11]|uniref:Transposase IS200-like domain-containing protein n=2 Tax=Candidatus Curtissiibacteriota TaxID=1752717 RepID=A0A1F5G813_9BACT|nr:MAG: hypothetical protein A3D04_02960 [Candidatus Curtissbacteria bacterium RIFCSPHIGHO2_02_FULL_40_16b]OGD90192.1 MAG: hypothetical protein A3E11_00545 [Candidatus Curtissbacteria bacterium RIFCSPHIGHO2_12_FULL_38_37]OGE00788.1 MAG: hypothetical protein A3J17_02215 [Candidatus Curtissbacteria bacterium RIFCSPLOWO2_02_FULL_40_11]OGE14274.1 MAG: hypothetical protein A3G14_04515 [Candidatus Curtissbacteria bacterium RIFCSPLOWO2_12_FULL_38_9]
MPSKNSIKLYIDNSYYHIYNRGVEKRKIFLDKKDYKVFLSYLKAYLEPPKEPKKLEFQPNNTVFKGIRRPLNNFNKEIELTAYCLMPNHFHLLIHQKTSKAIEFFMRSLGTKYSQYFNKKYERVGYLFQGTYKAVLVENDNYLLHLTRYIHLNPSKESPLKGAYSSYSEYLGERKTGWVKPTKILEFFKTAQKTSLNDILSYQSFTEDYLLDPKEVLGELTID